MPGVGEGGGVLGWTPSSCGPHFRHRVRHHTADGAAGLRVRGGGPTPKEVVKECTAPCPDAHLRDLPIEALHHCLLIVERVGTSVALAEEVYSPSDACGATFQSNGTTFCCESRVVSQAR